MSKKSSSLKSGTPSSLPPYDVDVEAGRGQGPGLKERKTSEEAYPNYNTGYVWILLQLLVCIFLFLLWMPNPSKNTALIAAGTDYIGAFKKCAGTSCEDWLKGGAGAAPASAPAADADAADPSKAERRDLSLQKRASSLDEAVDPAKFFVNVGLGLLIAFYLSLYLTILLIVRLFKIPDPPTPRDSSEPPEVERAKVRGARRRKFKLFAYRASRSIGVINVVFIFGCLVATGKSVATVRNKMELSRSNGIGGGFFLLLMSLFLSLYSCVRDLCNPSGRIRIWLGFRCWFPNKILFWDRKPLPVSNKVENTEMEVIKTDGATPSGSQRSQRSSGGSSGKDTKRPGIPKRPRRPIVKERPQQPPGAKPRPYL
ncbi:uncharacterized protein MKK02DRAFT_32147 [Dioszegia hungarica]|uniref:Transmembrane protein n=1 Tax=Dioszegia hungarica TaxID=4972 RepID=A0AA38LXG1_9TREE|nr:uncharacterized protein MKK02DRAFT_32147 [Dioszegia hungarica]KAI9637261.1 hypothetical protein MKK02DRAFT_32147 [Dioszegia hungarica]